MSNRSLLIGLGILLAATSDAAAQSVRGRVVDAQTNRPLPTALVRLVDGAGEGVATTAADSTGRFELGLPEPGSYALTAELIGYENLESTPVEALDPSEVLVIELKMRAAPLPIRGVEVSTDQVNRKIRDFLGSSPGLLRIRPIPANRVRQHADRGDNLNDLMESARIPNFQVLRSREGPCYQFRNRGCLPIFIDGARWNRNTISTLPLQMISTVVVLLPNELVAYPEGAVHLLTIGYMR